MATATIGKWGNASALRLPKLFCDALHLSIGDDVKISVEDDARIVIEPVRADSTLKARMEQWDGVRYKNAETDWGMPVGEEIW